MMMRRTLSRNRIDVRDRVQVRIVKKRPKLTDAQLSDIIRKSSNSIAALGEAAGAKPCLSLPRQIATPAAATIAAAEPDMAVGASS